MNVRTKTALEILQVAVILGILGDILLRATPWGLNVTLFNTAFTAGMIMLLYRRAPEQLTKQTLALFGALIFFAAMFTWRDSIELRIADTVAIFVILSVLFVPKMKVTTQIAGVFHYGVAFLWSAFNAVFAPFVLLGKDIEWKNTPQTRFSTQAFAVLRGVAIAAPILLIFGALFVAADAVYEGWVQRVLNIAPETVVTHVLLFSLFSWMSAGYLRGVLIKQAEPVDPKSETAKTDPNLSPVDKMRAEDSERTSNFLNNLSILEHINISDPPDPQTGTPTAGNVSDEAETRPVGSVPDTSKKAKQWNWATLDNTVMPPAFTLGTVEVGVILGLINLLFLSFVIVQVPYLFGGMELVQNTPDFKLAEYARRGFGELVTVSALVLPILLASHWLIRKENPFTEKLFRVFAVIQIGLLFVIMASAVQRLVLLTGNLGYGLTTIRLYPMIFMTWLAIVFVWFGVTVLRSARKHFAWGALWSAFLILGATHVLNPDQFIVKTNLALLREGRAFDAFYNSNLSNDAVPVLMDSFAELGEDDQKRVIRQVVRQVCENREQKDLRSWNISRWRADRIIHSNNRLVAAIGDCSSEMYGSPEDDITR